MFQKDAMEDSVEIVIEKLLHVTKDVVPKVISSFYFFFFLMPHASRLSVLCAKIRLPMMLSTA